MKRCRSIIDKVKGSRAANPGGINGEGVLKLSDELDFEVGDVRLRDDDDDNEGEDEDGTCRGGAGEEDE